MFGKFTKTFLFFFSFIQISLSVFASVSVPFTLTENLSNDKTVIVASSGPSVGWGSPEIDNAGLTGICVGDFGGGFNWNDKYVDIAFTGVPDTLSFEGECAALTTGIVWYVKESTDGKNWSAQIWSSSDRMVRNAQIALSENTRYVRLCYSGNFRGCFANVNISAKYRLLVNVNDRTVVDKYVSKNTPLNFDTIQTTPADICQEFRSWQPEVPALMPAKDMTFDALFDVKQFVAHFVTRSPYFDKQDYDLTFECGEDVHVKDPYQAGYVFKGWSPSLPSVASASLDNQTFTAQWEKSPYRCVVYLTEVDSVVELYNYGDPLPPLTTPERLGYTFSGWDKELPQTMPDDDLTIKALWTPVDYKLIIYLTDDDYVQTVHHYGDDLTPLEEPLREGFTFNGWDKEQPAKMPAEDVTIHAKWSWNIYRLVVYTSETDSTVQELNYGDDIPSSAVRKPSKTGYRFLQWSEAVPDVMPAHDVILKAEWEAIPYTFTLLVDGSVYFQKTLTYGDPIDMSDYKDPTKRGYTFLGWGVEKLPENMPPYNLNYEAQWMEADHQIVVVNNSDDLTQNDTIDYAFGDRIKPLAEPIREGYSFLGWDNELPETMPNEDLKVIALWQLNDYRYVVYQTEEDSIVENHHFGDELNPLQTPSRVGYQFMGWNVEPVRTMPSTDYTIRALWSPLVYRYVVYLSDEDSVVSQKYYGDELEPLTEPTLTGYRFVGWDKEQPATMPASDFVIKSQWSLEAYELILQKGLDFDPQNDTLRINYSSDISLEDPEHEGYTFEGWNPALPATMPAEKVVTSAVWTKNKYRYVVYFSENDSLVENISFGELLDPLAEQTMTGYQFKGWDIQQPLTMPAHDLTIRALWEVKKYKVTLLLTEDQTYAQYELAYGADFVLDEYSDPIRAGYKFVGWNAAFPQTMPADDLTFEATWEASQFLLVVVNDPEDAAKNDTFTYDCDAKVATIEVPEREGYSFDGWSDEVPSVMPSHNLILTARWIPNRYTVSFYSDDQLFVSTEYKYKETIDYKNVGTPKKDGFVFLGWENAPETMPSNDLRLDARWSANAYSIVVINDPENLSKNDTVYYECTQPIKPLPIPVKEGYVFDGWNISLPENMPAENIEVVAQWTIGHFTLTTLVNCQPTIYEYVYGDPVSVNDPEVKGYQFNGWSADVPQTMPGNNMLLIADMSLLSYPFVTVVDDVKDTIVYHYTDLIQQPAIPEKEGFIFEAWNPLIPESMPAEEVIVEALWNRNSYTITYVSDGDTLNVDTYLYEEPVNEPTVPTKEGSTFLGWGDELPATMPATDLVYEAEWKLNSYGLTIIAEDTVTYKYFYGATIPEIDMPKKIGYSFVNWNKSVPETMPAYNDTIEAEWTRNEYVLSWITEEGADTIADRYYYGDPVVPLPNPTRKGYEFLGWNGEVPTTMPAADVQLEAEWNALDYVMEFVVNGKSETYKYKYQEVVEMPNDPALEGYTFMGWIPQVPATMPDSSMVIEAQMSLNSYWFIAMLDDDTIVARKLNYQDEVDALEEPVKTGWKFVEWLPSLPERMPSSDVLVEASMEQLYYSFVKIVDEDTVTYTLTYGEQLPIIDAPEKKGYTFLQWSKDIPESMDAQNDTVVALWQANKYALVLTILPDSAAVVDSIAFGENLNVREDWKRHGYRFLGWNESVPATMPAYPVYLEAKWERTIFTLTYLLDGDTLSSVDYEVGEKVETMEVSKEGWTWNGWSPELPVEMPAEDLVVEALMNINTYALHIIVGNDTTDRLYTYHARVNKPSDPKIEGYTFVAWNDTFPSIMPAHDVTIQAEMKRNAYCLILDVDGRKDSVWYDYGEVVKEPSHPFKPGYVFSGWSEELPETMPDHDVKVSALWTNDFYHLYLVVDGDTITNAYRYGDPVAHFPNPGIAGGDFDRWSQAIPAFMPDSDVTIVALFNMRKYELTVVDSLSENIVTVYTIPCRDSIRVEIPSHLGYSFIQWDRDLPVIMPEHDLQVVALWKNNQHRFVVVVDEDTVVNKIYLYGDSVAAPTVPAVMEGYSFDRWSDSIPVVMPDSDVIINALINVNTYNLTFVSEGDTLQRLTYAYGVKIIQSEIVEPEKNGFRFVEWSQAIPEKMLAHDMIFDAVWEAVGYSITYLTDEDTVVVRYDCGAEIPAYSPVPNEGYAFVGWTPALPETMPAKDLVVRGKFEKQTYEFTYVTNKKTTTVSYNFGDTVEMPEAPTRKGYIFVKWSDSIPETMPSHDVKINAVWEAMSYELVLVADGKVIRRSMVAYGDSLDLPKTVLKSGHNFTGWDKIVPATMPAQNLTLTAEFKATGELIVYTKDQTLYITGLPDNAEAIVWDVLGRMVYRGFDREINLMRNGVYTVRAKHQTVKVLVR